MSHHRLICICCTYAPCTAQLKVILINASTVILFWNTLINIFTRILVLMTQSRVLFPRPFLITSACLKYWEAKAKLPLQSVTNAWKTNFELSLLQDGDKADRQSWASFDIRTAQPDEPIAGLLDKVDVEVMDGINASKRMERRTETVYSLYPEQDEGDIVERRHTADLPSEIQTHRILVKCLELSLALQDREPVLASMARYDAKERRKGRESLN